MLAWTPTADPDRPIEITYVDTPTPAPSEAVVQVEAFSVNRGETFLLEAPRPGWRPGKDVAGTVVQEAADGTGPSRGQRVVGHPPSQGWAEEVAVSTDALAVLPPDIASTTAAALPLAGITALRLLRLMPPLPGLRVLLTGASGGVGHYLTELAAAGGAQVTAVVTDPAQGARLAGFGAHIVASVPEAGDGFDVALESVGGDSLPAVLDRVRSRGLVIWFGQAGRQPATLDFFRVLNNTPSVSLRQFDYTDGPGFDHDLQTLVRLVSQGHLHPEVGRIEDWSHTRQVLTDLRDRKIRGNAVLTLSIGSASDDHQDFDLDSVTSAPLGSAGKLEPGGEPRAGTRPAVSGGV